MGKSSDTGKEEPKENATAEKIDISNPKNVQKFGPNPNLEKKDPNLIKYGSRINLKLFNILQ